MPLLLSGWTWSGGSSQEGHLTVAPLAWWPSPIDSCRAKTPAIPPTLPGQRQRGEQVLAADDGLRFGGGCGHAADGERAGRGNDGRLSPRRFRGNGRRDERIPERHHLGYGADVQRDD